MADEQGAALTTTGTLPGVLGPDGGNNRSEPLSGREGVGFALLGDPMPWPRAGLRVQPGKGPGEAVLTIKGARYVRNPFVGHYTPTEAARRMEALRGAWARSGARPFEEGEPLLVEVEAIFARPVGHYGTGRNAGIVKPQFLTARPGKGGNKNADGRRTGADEDNLGKLVKDALTGVAYPDDGQIAESRVRKLYVDQAGVVEPQTVVLVAPAPLP